MAINFCDLCNDPCIQGQIGTANMQEVWRTLVAQALCAANQGGAPVMPLPQTSLGFAELQSDYATYADPGFMNGQTRLRRLRVVNGTDAVIEISLDNGVSTYMSVAAGEDTGMLDLGNVVLADAADFQIKRADGDSATSGTLLIQGSY